MPKRLRETERRKLARYFSIPESLLGGPEDEAAPGGLVPVIRSPVRASAGSGALPGEEGGRPTFAFEDRWLKALTASRPDQLSIIKVEGDSMSPTLSAGDDILVDRGDCNERLRDGIYVFRADDVLVVKRLALHPVGGKVTLQSDNPAYPDWPDCNLDEIHCIGRVIWAGSRID